MMRRDARGRGELWRGTVSDFLGANCDALVSRPSRFAAVTSAFDYSPPIAVSVIRVLLTMLTCRRDFIKWTGAAAAVALASRLKAAAAPTRKPFEVSASVYAWELHDEGVERVLDNLQQMAAVTSVYLLGVMHPEGRPFGGVTFPHNPVRQTWQAEDARCYWHPDPKRYGRVQPRLSDFAWLNQTDWLRVLVDAARKRGLKAGVELSHALLDRQRMAGELSELAQRNIHGEITKEGAIKWLRPPCPNHPDTIDYVVGLTSDPVANHGVDFVQSCIMAFDPAPPEKGGGCFCAHCRRAAKEAGLDLAAVQAKLLADATNAAARRDWQDFRERSVVDFYARLHRALHALRRDVDLRYNLHSHSYPLYGINLARMKPHLDSLRTGDYAEQEGDARALPAKRAWLADVRGQLGTYFPMIAAIGVRLKATPEIVREGVRNAIDVGVEGIGLGHYDGAMFSILRAVGEEVRAERR
jgi:hypothetical protein